MPENQTTPEQRELDAAMRFGPSLTPRTTLRCQHEPYQGRCIHCDVRFVDGRPADRRHVTVTIGRHTLLALARGEAVHLNEIEPGGVVTLIHASDYPSALLLMLETPDVE